MSDLYQWLLPLAAGGIMGLAFFGGLWLTARRVARARNPILVLFGSFLLRMMLLALCFYALVQLNGWIGVLIGLLGLVAIRSLFVVSIRGDDREQSLPPRGSS
jgi:F1F0 ATPase subunit 2